MGRQGGLAGIEFGKVKVYTSEESTSLEKTFEVFVKVMKKFGYPEQEYFQDEEESLLKDLAEDNEQSTDKREVHKTEIKEGDKESPWLRAKNSNKVPGDENL